MGIRQDLEESDSKFISISEAITLLAKLEGCSETLAFNWMIDKKIYDNQILLFRELESVSISSFYEDDAYRSEADLEEGEYSEHIERKKTFLNTLELKYSVNKSLDNSVLMRDLLQYGFARKRFYDTLTVNNIYIHPTEWEKAKSFFDSEPALTIEEYLAYHQAPTIEELESRNSSLLEVANLKAEIESLRKENEHRKNAFKAYQAVSDSSKSQVFDSDLKEKIEKVEGELAIAREYIKKLEADLQSARMSIKDMQQKTTSEDEKYSPAITGVLLLLLKEHHPRKTQEYWICRIEKMKELRYPNARAFSKSQLQKAFAIAKRSLKRLEKQNLE